MKISEVSISEIKMYEKNQKKHPDEQINNIAISIDKYGFVQPLVLDSNNEIIIGHGRYLAAKKLGIEKVPSVYADNLSEEQIRELRIIDNKLNESEWDFEQLKADLDELDFSDFDIDFDIDETTEENNGDDSSDYDVTDDNTYTQKMEVPQYEVTGEVPKLAECFDKEKYEQLVKSIESSSVSDEEKQFMLFASSRHIAFDYSKVAEYYAAASAEMQKLMEENALVIIDFDSAIKNGYVLLNKRIQEMIENGEK